jgi:hypothetical protein
MEGQEPTHSTAVKWKKMKTKKVQRERERAIGREWQLTGKGGAVVEALPIEALRIHRLGKVQPVLLHSLHPLLLAGDAAVAAAHELVFVPRVIPGITVNCTCGSLSYIQ